MHWWWSLQNSREMVGLPCFTLWLDMNKEQNKRHINTGFFWEDRKFHTGFYDGCWVLKRVPRIQRFFVCHTSTWIPTSLIVSFILSTNRDTLLTTASASLPSLPTPASLSSTNSQTQSPLLFPRLPPDLPASYEIRWCLCLHCSGFLHPPCSHI